MLYVTCSISQAESKRDRSSALSARRRRVAPHHIARRSGGSGDQLLPGAQAARHNHDGYFTPCWKKPLRDSRLVLLTHATRVAASGKSLLLGLTTLAFALQVAAEIDCRAQRRGTRGTMST